MVMADDDDLFGDEDVRPLAQCTTFFGSSWLHRGAADFGSLDLWGNATRTFSCIQTPDAGEGMGSGSPDISRSSGTLECLVASTKEGLRLAVRVHCFLRWS